MAATITYNGNTIRESNRTESFTLLTNNLIMKSDIVIYVDEETRVEVIYNGEALNLDTNPGEHTYNLLCANKLMLSNLTISVSIEGSINYTNVMICDTDGNVNIPSSNIMIVVIGGGTGGQGGYKGKNGNKPTIYRGSAYTIYAAKLSGSQQDFGIADDNHNYTINPSLYYKSVFLNSDTGVLTFQSPLNGKLDTLRVTGTEYKKYVKTDGYKYFKASSTAYWDMDIRKVSGVDHIIGFKLVVTSSTAYKDGVSRYDSYTAGGSGGIGGYGGQGGKVFKKELTIPSGETVSASITIGSGGTGGASEGKYGLAGSPTTIVINGITYSSDDGIFMPDGFVNTVGVLEPEIYASQGIDGIEGASGGGYNLYYNSEIGNGVLENAGGAVGSNYKTSGASVQYIGGGSGGGAAYGKAGGAGEDASLSKTGKGGNGASADAATPALSAGCGGNGGHGGGGGGNAGGSQVTDISVSSAGSGGSGGAGSAGANGIVLIYYN